MNEDLMKNSTTPGTEEPFDPSRYVRTMTDEEGTASLYLDVKYRILWFRHCCPDGKIDTEIVHADERSAIICSKVYEHKTDTGEQYIGKAYAQRFASSERFGDRYLETAETAAIGRALAAAGFGTQFCGAGENPEAVIADAPVEIRNRAKEEPAREKNVPQKRSMESPTAKRVEAAPEQPKTYEQLLASMSLAEAENVVVDFGKYAGNTLGQVAQIQPRDLAWYAKNYTGRNMRLKAGAVVLLQAASQHAD